MKVITDADSAINAPIITNKCLCSIKKYLRCLFCFLNALVNEFEFKSIVN